MCDDWMPTLRLKLPIEEFRQLPRNSAYKYEYLSSYALLSPRPRHYHARLSLVAPPPESVQFGDGLETTTRLLQAEDWPNLERTFEAAFYRVQPFGSLTEETLAQASKQCLERARTGGDGPLIEQASFVGEHDGKIVGAVLITLLPEGDPCDWDSYYWREPPPGDALARKLGRPHLTWIFVSTWFAGHGLGSRLLGRAVHALRDLGYTELLSTFLAGNDVSTLWHWRNGFELLANPGSMRLMKERRRSKDKIPDSGR